MLLGLHDSFVHRSPVQVRYLQNGAVEVRMYVGTKKSLDVQRFRQRDIVTVDALQWDTSCVLRQGCTLC